MTRSEARRVASDYQFGIANRIGKFAVYLLEWAQGADAKATYYTDDLEDAVLMGMKMRRGTPMARIAYAVS